MDWQRKALRVGTCAVVLAIAIRLALAANSIIVASGRSRSALSRAGIMIISVS